MKSIQPLFALLLLGAGAAHAASPECVGSEAKLSWPADNPVWEMCWLRPSQSSGVQGSGLEVRNVHYKGILVLKTAHSPILFAEYTSSTCYRDWKDSNSSLIAEPVVRNMLGTSVEFPATTSCDRSNHPTQSYGTCPFQLAGHSAADCFTGVSIEDGGDHVTLTTQYVAGWYLYSSRFTFFADGSFSPEMGFGNSNGTLNSTTHWHHNYWRLDFDIDGSENNQFSINDVIQDTEFTALIDRNGGPGGGERTFEVRNSQTGRGYRMFPGDFDYESPANQSGRGFHLVDVLGTVYHPGEYADRPTNNLGDCAFLENNLANGEDLSGPEGTGTNVVLYDRGGVRDRTNEGPGTQDSMICKKVGPVFVPFGNWELEPHIFSDGFE
ncbi:MAG TPA: hypothetical protein PKZ76_01670 [Xanthomonadaceae bacterium]|nr:hypothetical protein [Xanthomonadaceae bacterium]